MCAMTDGLPALCMPFASLLGLPKGLCAQTLCFDSALLQAEDFARYGIAAVSGNAKRQAEYLAGRLCARQALRALTGTAVTVARADDGRPLWPSGIVGSITHSHGRAAAVVAFAQDFRALGLDMERCLAPERAQRLAKAVLTLPEQQRFAALPEDAQGLALTLNFSFKESLFKALYPLCLERFYFQDAALLDWQEGRAVLQLLRDLPGFAAGSRFDGCFWQAQEYLLSLVAIPEKPA